jgi:hypothetical protein
MKPEYRFRCTACNADVTVVGESVRRSLLANGCLVCSAAASPDDFEPREATVGEP